MPSLVVISTSHQGPALIAKLLCCGRQQLLVELFIVRWPLGAVSAEVPSLMSRNFSKA
jgi:hypothetical protein